MLYIYIKIHNNITKHKKKKKMGKFIIEIFLHTFRCSFYFLASCQTVSVTRCAPWWTSWAGSSASCSSQRWISQSLSLGPEWAGFVSLTPPGVRPLGLGMPLTFLHTCSCNGEPQLYLLQKKRTLHSYFWNLQVFFLNKAFLQFLRQCCYPWKELCSYLRKWPFSFCSGQSCWPL